MRKTKKFQARPAASTPATPKSGLDATATSGTPVSAVYYGLEAQLLLNVTDSIIQKCLGEDAVNGTWTLPADDVARAISFGDPIPFIVKNVYLRKGALDGKGFSETIVSAENTCTFAYQEGVLSVK